MLKWLRQRPIGNGQELDEKMTTDDPLATIQVHPINTKKSLKSVNSSSANEIYAVSRVNPLFEEEEIGKELLFSPGNHSGSSGYDSGPSDDDISTSKFHGAHTQPSFDGRPANGGVILPKQLPQLFSDNDDLLIRHEATIVGPPANSASNAGQPVLHVVQQSQAYVKDIVVTSPPLPANRPLSPIPELRTAKFHGQGQTKRVSELSVPTRTVEPIKPGDSIGAAKVLQRNLNYVQSIRIAPSPAKNASFERNGGYINPKQSNRSRSSNQLGRKPSVTFSDQVDVVDAKAAGSSSSSSRRSSEQDSIVTDSLLVMTSEHQLLNYKKGIRVSSVTAEIHERPELSLNNLGSDLASFSNSLSKNPMVKQIVSTSSSSHQGDDSISTHSLENEYDDVENYLTSSSESAPSEKQVRPRCVTTGSKSPFGGIADHYAAAKEIAKEIESYATGTTKSTKISLVRDLLLSNRGRGGAGSSSAANWPGRGRDDQLVLKVDGDSRTLLKTVVQIQPSSAKHLSSSGEESRLQPKVYVKANNSNEVATTTGTTLPASGHHHGNSNFGIPKSQPQLTQASTSSTTGTTSHKALSVDVPRRQNEGQDQQQVPIYEALPGSSSHRRRQDDSDSGNSTDRSPKELRPDDPITYSGKPSRVVISTTIPKLHSDPNRDPDEPTGKQNPHQPDHHPARQNLSDNTRPAPSVSNDKVMIVSGDSQNMVVDLSAVPLDLREAIISGQALVTLPEGLGHQLEPGYTMINVPQDHEYERIPPYPPTKGNDRKSQPKHPSKEDRKKYGTNNLTHVWDVMQHSSGAKGKDKRITTVIPYHPNQDAHMTAADFTIEGHRLALQTKRVKKLKTRRCICRLCGVVVFLLSFLGVIVALSLVYTNGKHYFGSI